MNDQNLQTQEIQSNKRTKFLHRFKSWTVWLAIGNVIIFAAREIFHIDLGDVVNGTLNVIHALCIALGVLNNPTDPDNI